VKASEVFVKRDVRRRTTVIQPMGWVALALVLILAATIGAACWQQCSGPGIGPTSTPTTPPTPSPTSDVPTPSYTPIVHEECPSNPALWTLVPYTSTVSTRTLYMIDPPCVMEAAEQSYRDYYAARADHGRYWTLEDDYHYYYWGGAIEGPVSGEVLYPPETFDWDPVCAEVVHVDGSPLTGDDYRVAFFTASVEKLVVDLVVLDGGYRVVVREYDCETGELVDEREAGEGGALTFKPMVYNVDVGRWQLAFGYDSRLELTDEEVAADATVGEVLAAQGRWGD
jgi:hypothetical protein